MRSAIAVLVALVVCPVAAAFDVSTPRMDAIATWAAGKPVSAWCENDPTTWATMAASRGMPATIEGFATPGGDTIYLAPQPCANLGYAADDPRLAFGLNVLLHEATHARGWVDEALTECAARVLIYSTLHDFYNVPWFSTPMRVLVDQSLAYSRAKPAAYQGGCDRL